MRGVRGSGPTKATKAVNNPVVRKHALDTTSQTVGQDVPRVMKTTGAAADSLESALHVPAESKELDQEWVANMAFMEEMVEVYIHPTHDKNASPVFDVGCNGPREFFRYGETKTVARKYVNILATRKNTTYSQQERKNDQGIIEQVQIPHSALMYNFTVTRDPNPMGAVWLKAALASA
jgi:hypothetical protein